jgi:hypothetical protein
MKTFTCNNCQQILYFESTQCTQCGLRLQYLPDQRTLAAVEELPTSGNSASPPRLRPLGDASRLYVACANQVQHAACNWAVPLDALAADSNADEPAPYCMSCRLNELVPDLTQRENLARWRQLETAKRRLLYSLMRLELPFIPKSVDPQAGLSFRFLAQNEGDARVVTGHADGVITINLAEADPAWRERTRETLGEAYRTVLGHFRHEIGHFYWDRLIKGGPLLEPFRELFGDEEQDYEQALAAHYGRDVPGSRQPGYVSAYAAMHPWEDWAETWAHYLHMVDTLETARCYGLSLTADGESSVRLPRTDLSQFDQLLTAWIPVTLALNSLNRSMGLPDPYPFTLDEGVIAKLRFIHTVLGQHAAGGAQRPHPEAVSQTEDQTALEQAEPHPAISSAC